MVFFLLWRIWIPDLFVMGEQYSQSNVLSWKYFLQKEIVERLQEAGGRWWWLFQVKTSFCIILSKLFQIKTSSKYVFTLYFSFWEQLERGWSSGKGGKVGAQLLRAPQHRHWRIQVWALQTHFHNCAMELKLSYSTHMRSITPPLGDPGSPVQIILQYSGQNSCLTILVSTFVPFQGRVFLSPYFSTTAVSPIASICSPGCKINFVLKYFTN